MRVIINRGNSAFLKLLRKNMRRNGFFMQCDGVFGCYVTSKQYEVEVIANPGAALGPDEDWVIDVHVHGRESTAGQQAVIDARCTTKSSKPTCFVQDIRNYGPETAPNLKKMMKIIYDTMKSVDKMLRAQRRALRGEPVNA